MVLTIVSKCVYNTVLPKLLASWFDGAVLFAGVTPLI